MEIMYIQTISKSIIAYIIEHSKTNELVVDWPMELVTTMSHSNQPMLHFMPLTTLCEETTISLNKNMILFYTKADKHLVKEYNEVIQQIKAQKANIILPGNQGFTSTPNNVIDLKKY